MGESEFVESALLEALSSRLLRSFQAETGIRARLIISPAWPRKLRAGTATRFYQAVEAALGHVEHSAAGVRSVEVVLRVDDSCVVVAASDDGSPRAQRGRAPDRHLTLLRELALLLGGRLVIEPRPGGGTAVKLIAPIGGRLERFAEIRPARILVIDDGTLLRGGVAAVLHTHPRVEVVGGPSSSDEALGLVSALQPDAVLIEATGSGRRSVELVRQIKSAARRVTVVLVADSDPETCRQALMAGASGFVLPDPDSETLVSTIVAALRGQCVIPRALWPASGQSRSTELPEELTPRELEVLCLAAAGLSNKEIARRLGASYKTVRNHISSIYTKLQIHDRSQALIYSIRRGLVQIPG